jgi:hypothetical protein
MARDTQRASNLLASVTEELLGGDLNSSSQDNTLRVERILLELVRPDPVQPRRVLPAHIHQPFHQNRLTPTQALRELIQMVQVVARQKGRPFTDVLELLPDMNSEQEEETPVSYTPEERLLRDLVNLALTIRDDGQVNPLTVVDMTQGVSRLYRIETGERRYWATWLLRDFIPQYTGDGMIPCIVIPAERASIFRQAKENSARSGLSAIAMARQAALLLLTVHGYEIPNRVVDNDSYRQALNLDLRSKREYTEAILTAMGGIGRMHFSRYKALLELSDEAMEIADRYELEEGILRYVLNLPVDAHAEMVQQIVQLGLTGKQVREICGQANESSSEDEHYSPSPCSMRLIRSLYDVDRETPYEFACALRRKESNLHLAKARLEAMISFLQQAHEDLEAE